MIIVKTLVKNQEKGVDIYELSLAFLLSWKSPDTGYTTVCFVKRAGWD